MAALPIAGVEVVITRIGPLRLFAEIKRRENRSTYRGLDTDSGEIVLVKVFEPSAVPDEDDIARFQQEAALYASVDHPNVVRLVRLGVEEKRPYLALEFIEGDNLRTVLSRQSPLPADIALCIFHSLLAGLFEIHRHGIVHRDLKPENVMLGDDGRVKICDFDLAVGRREEGPPAPNGLLGSAGYFSPEAILGEAITARSDLFAAGVILYEMFTGTRPFAAATASGEMKAIVHLPHLPASKFNRATPAEVDRLVDWLLAKSPDARPGSAEEVLTRLKACFQIPEEAEKTEMMRRYLADPQSYQGEGLEVEAPAEGTARPQRRKVPWGLIAAGALGLGIVAVAFQRFRSVDPAPDNGHATVVEEPQRSRPAARTPPDSAVTIPEPRTPRTPSVSAKTIQGPDNRERVQPSLLSEEPQTREEPARVAVFVYSTPWAYLFVDGDSVGQVPGEGSLVLAVGAHELVFKNPRLPPIAYRVEVDSTTADTLRFSLWDRVAQLQLKIIPWADLFVDDEPHEAPPEGVDLFLLPGEHRLRFVHPHLGERREVVFLRPREVRRLSVNMFLPTTRNQ